MPIKLPPPIQVVIAALIMWFVSAKVPFGNVLPDLSVLGWTFIICGLGLNIYVAMIFRRVKTTINPMVPEKASHLVDDGPFKYSRNPIYVAMAAMLLGFILLFGNVLNVIVLGLFIWSMNEFPIKGEEKALAETFGQSYEDYKSRVRRWI